MFDTNGNISRTQNKTQSRVAPITQAKNNGKRKNKTLVSSFTGKSYHSLQKNRGIKDTCCWSKKFY